jgi:hypothetical protein
MISYYIQVALICLIALLLPVAIWLFNVFSWKAGIRTTPLLRKLQKSVYEINSFFSISLLVASMVRWRQVPPVMETMFIFYMEWNQMSNTIFMLYALLYDRSINKATLTWDWNLYYAAIGLAHLIATCLIGIPNRATYRDLATQCKIQQKMLNVADLITVSEQLKTALMCSILVLGISLVLVNLAGFFRKTPQKPKKQGNRTIAIGILLIMVAMPIHLAQLLAEIRGMLKKLSGDQLPENGWGYGEVIAILLWVPLLWSLLKETMSKAPNSNFLLQSKLIKIVLMRAADSIQQVGAQKQAVGQILGFTLELAPDAGPSPYTSEKGEATLPV